ncbi:MAG: phage tail protein I [Muribaculum sp.]|nr:phage tail protein I [Muribaculum sp.]
MSETIYDSDFTKYLPGPLTHDPKMIALAKAAADELLTVSGAVENVLIYSRIDELPEELVDILAYDFHVDWYDYSYPLAAKRDLLKSSVRVHKKMGTKYAIEKALSALYPESEVEEWFEYEGEPGHFHIVCDVTNSRITASYSDIVRAVRLYKRLSAHMDEVVYQSHIHCEIHTHTDFFLYHVPMTGKLNAGTHPQRNRRGVNYGSSIVVGTEAAGFIFVNPAAGTIPERNTVFHGRTAQIDAETALNVFRYRNIPAGQINAGEAPQRSHRGGSAGAVMEAAGETAAFHFTSPAAGTDPDRSTVFHHQQAQIDAETASNAFGYRNTPTGQKRAGEAPQRSHRGGSAGAAVEVEGEAEAHTFTSTAAGTVPERSTAQRTEGGAVENTVQASGFSYTVKQCGSSRKL